MIDHALYVTKLKLKYFVLWLVKINKGDKEKLFNAATQQKPFFRFMDDKIQIHADS